jgi:hypothetical protein
MFKTVFVVIPGGIGWSDFAAVLDRHRVNRLIDTRADGAIGGGFSVESWANLSRFERWEEQVVRADLKKLLDEAGDARLALLDGGHLVRLVNELGGHCFRIEQDGKLVGITGAKTPVIAMRRTTGTSLRPLHSRF